MVFGFTLSVEASRTLGVLQVGSKCKGWEDKQGGQRTEVSPGLHAFVAFME